MSLSRRLIQLLGLIKLCLKLALKGRWCRSVIVGVSSLILKVRLGSKSQIEDQQECDRTTLGTVEKQLQSLLPPQ